MIDIKTDIYEHITFVEFNSRNENLFLMEREAPSPEEYEAVLSVPNRHGVLDFSHLDGERKFKNRKIKYEFKMFNTPYSQRKATEIRLKRKLMLGYSQKLRDTHDQGFFWLGKCSNVKVEDGEEFNSLTVKIEFNVYPFMYREFDRFNDVWNEFYFETDFANFTAYEVDGEKEIILWNAGDTKVRPIIQLERL